MDDFGKRLKEERERLGLSQEKFGAACGIGKTTQYLYERGERHPGTLYLDAAEKLGVDTHYVFTGTRKGKDWAYARAYSRMLYAVEMLLGLEEKRLEHLATELVELDDKADWFGDNPDKTDDRSVNFEPWMARFQDWLGSASKVERCVDVTLLARLVDAVEREATAAQVELASEKALRAALMLYQGAKEGGEIDPRRVADAVKLAS